MTQSSGMLRQRRWRSFNSPLIRLSVALVCASTASCAWLLSLTQEKAKRETITCTGATTRVTLTDPEFPRSPYEGMAAVLLYPDQECMDKPRRYFRIDGPILLLDAKAVSDSPEFLKLAGQRVRVSGVVDGGRSMRVVSGGRKLSEREEHPFFMEVTSIEPE